MKDKSLPASATALKHEHCFNQQAVSQVFRNVEGAQVWYNLTKNMADRAGYKAKMKRYHQEVILTCEGRIEMYVQLLEQKLTTHGGFMMN